MNVCAVIGLRGEISCSSVVYKQPSIDAAQVHRTLTSEQRRRARVTGATTGDPRPRRPSLATENEPLATRRRLIGQNKRDANYRERCCLAPHVRLSRCLRPWMGASAGNHGGRPRHPTGQAGPRSGLPRTCPEHIEGHKGRSARTDGSPGVFHLIFSQYCRRGIAES